MLTVLLVEDDLDLAATVVQYLQLEGICCDHASHGVAGLAFIRQHHYDAVLLDLNLPRMDGLQVCEQLRQGGDNTPVLMLTARDQLQDKIEGFRAGTDDYVVKPFELEELRVRIEALARRRSGQARVLRYAEVEMNLDSRTVQRSGQTLRLSPIGWQLMEMLLRSAPHVVSRQQLEQAVWGDNVPDSNSLKVHMFNLRKALDAGFTEPLLQTRAGSGFALQVKEDQQG